MTERIELDNEDIEAGAEHYADPNELQKLGARTAIKAVDKKHIGILPKILHNKYVQGAALLAVGGAATAGAIALGNTDDPLATLKGIGEGALSGTTNALEGIGGAAESVWNSEYMPANDWAKGGILAAGGLGTIVLANEGRKVLTRGTRTTQDKHQAALDSLHTELSHLDNATVVVHKNPNLGLGGAAA